MRQGALIGSIAAAVLCQCAVADNLVLGDGARLAGRVHRLDADAVELTSCGSRRMYLRAAVRSIEFNQAAGECSKEPPDLAPVSPGTKLLVKLTRPIDPVRDPVGQVIGGSLVQPVSLGDRLLIRDGAPVLMRLQPARGGAGPPVLHITAVRLDSGWCSIDATDDDARVTVAATPGSLSHPFTVQ
jgi:hypothetical protein